MFVCRFGVEVSKYISVVSQRDIYGTGEFDGGVNVVKIVDENF